MPSQPYRTSADLVLGALSKLQILSPGQRVNPEDFETINQNLDSLFRKLAALELVYVADPANIPAEWFADLVLIVAGESADDFGATGAELDAFINRGLGGSPGGSTPVLGGSAAKSLKIMLRGRPTGEPQRTLSY
jgi:hypothetical protein